MCDDDNGDIKSKQLTSELFSKGKNYFDEDLKRRQSRLAFYGVSILFSAMPVIGFFMSDPSQVRLELIAGFLVSLALLSVMWCLIDAGSRCSRLFFYRSLMIESPYLSVEDIAELFDVPVKRVKHDLKRIKLYNIYSTQQPQIVIERKSPTTSGQSQRLKELSEKISNQVLRDAVKELTQASELQCNSSKAEYLKDNYLPRIESLLEWYVELGADIPDGYDSLLELISTVTETFNQIKVAEEQQAEMDFSAEALAVLQSLSMNQLTYSDFNQSK